MVGSRLDDAVEGVVLGHVVEVRAPGSVDGPPLGEHHDLGELAAGGVVVWAEGVVGVPGDRPGAEEVAYRLVEVITLVVTSLKLIVTAYASRGGFIGRCAGWSSGSYVSGGAGRRECGCVRGRRAGRCLGIGWGFGRGTSCLYSCRCLRGWPWASSARPSELGPPATTSRKAALMGPSSGGLRSC